MTLIVKPGFNGMSDPDASAYVAAVEAADGQLLENAVGSAINSFVLGCKNDGIWSAIEIASIFNGARTRAGSYIDLKSATQIVSNTGTDAQWTYGRKTGLKGDASNTWLNTNRAENADAQDSSHIAVYVLTAPTMTATKIFIGAANTEIRSTGTSSLQYRSRSSTATTVSSVGGTLGLIGLSRNSSSAYSYKYGTTAIASATTTSSAPGSNAYGLFSTNGGGNKSDVTLGFYSIGRAIDLDLLATRVKTLIDAIGAAIP